jgi:hypothetical protein
MHTSAMSDRVAAQTQQTADVGRRLEMHAHEMTSRMTFASAKKGAPPLALLPKRRMPTALTVPQRGRVW